MSSLSYDVYIFSFKNKSFVGSSVALLSQNKLVTIAGDIYLKVTYLTDPLNHLSQNALIFARIFN